MGFWKLSVFLVPEQARDHLIRPVGIKLQVAWFEVKMLQFVLPSHYFLCHMMTHHQNWRQITATYQTALNVCQRCQHIFDGQLNDWTDRYHLTSRCSHTHRASIVWVRQSDCVCIYMWTRRVAARCTKWGFAAQIRRLFPNSERSFINVGWANVQSHNPLMTKCRYGARSASWRAFAFSGDIPWCLSLHAYNRYDNGDSKQHMPLCRICSELCSLAYHDFNRW